MYITSSWEKDKSPPRTMYNKKTLTFTFHHYWGAFCQGAFVLDPFLVLMAKFLPSIIMYM